MNGERQSILETFLPLKYSFASLQLYLIFTLLNIERHEIFTSQANISRKLRKRLGQRTLRYCKIYAL